MTTLSVNVNKVALLRNSRTSNLPSVTRAAELCLKAGAHGITVHPRPDERHIRGQDVLELAVLLKTWPDREFNIEGNPFHNLMDIVHQLCFEGRPPHQCTLVPDSHAQLTSDHGWDLTNNAERLRPIISQLRQLGIRVSLFMNPDPHTMSQAKDLGADRVELYTEHYARTWGTAEQTPTLNRYTKTAEACVALHLGVNAGHDLNRHNLRDFLHAVPNVDEVSIGHALIADALELGYAETVRTYLECL